VFCRQNNIYGNIGLTNTKKFGLHRDRPPSLY